MNPSGSYDDKRLWLLKGESGCVPSIPLTPITNLDEFYAAYAAECDAAGVEALPRSHVAEQMTKVKYSTSAGTH